jgi:uncharacterized protein (TIGR02597 family)
MSATFSATNNQGEHRFMNLTLRNFTGAILAISALFIQDVRAGVAQPSGIANVTVPGGLGRTEFFGMPFARPVEFTGTINSVSSSSGNATFSVTLDAGQGSLPALNNTSQSVDAWYVLEILDGPAIGFLLPCTGNSGDTSITVEGDTGSISAEGAKFALRKEWTLSTLFGTAGVTNKFGYGSSASAATVNGWVQVFNVATGTLISYYVNESGTTTKSYNWRSSTSTVNRNHVPLRLGRGLVLINRKSTDLTVPVSGEYRVARTRLSVPAGKLSFLANPGPSDVTFDAATIPATSPTRASGNPSGTSGDTWQMWNPVTRTFTSYRVGGTSNTNGPSMYSLANARVNPTIPAFKAVGVKPVGTSGNVVVTIAPNL